VDEKVIKKKVKVAIAYPSLSDDDDDNWLLSPSVDKTSRLNARSETGELKIED